MKRIIVILLVLVYAFPSIGFSFTLHYCDDEISSVSLGFSNTESCGCSAESEKKGCCDNKTVTIKNDTKHQKTNTVQVAKIEFTVEKTSVHPIFENNYLIHSASVDLIANCESPPLPKTLLFILYNVFRI